jgi:hypothetical protein
MLRGWDDNGFFRVLQEMLRLEAPCFVILEPLSVYEVEATGHGQKDG